MEFNKVWEQGQGAPQRIGLIKYKDQGKLGDYFRLANHLRLFQILDRFHPKKLLQQILLQGPVFYTAGHECFVLIINPTMICFVTAVVQWVGPSSQIGDS